MTSISLSHFILDLRSIYLPASIPSTSSHRNTTLHFASNVQGNFGASLDDSWATGEERDIEEEEEIQYSENPLATGLLNTGRNREDERVKENFGEISEAG